MRIGADGLCLLRLGASLLPGLVQSRAASVVGAGALFAGGGVASLQQLFGGLIPVVRRDGGRCVENGGWW